MKAVTYIYRISTSAKPEVHAAPGAQIATFVNQSRIHFAWRLILKTRAVKFLADFDFLSLAEGAR